jgi:hypothetical protein
MPDCALVMIGTGCRQSFRGPVSLPNEPVLVTAARLRFGLDVKGYGWAAARAGQFLRSPRPRTARPRDGGGHCGLRRQHCGIGKAAGDASRFARWRTTPGHARPGDTRHYRERRGIVPGRQTHWRPAGSRAAFGRGIEARMRETSPGASLPLVTNEEPQAAWRDLCLFTLRRQLVISILLSPTLNVPWPFIVICFN